MQRNKSGITGQCEEFLLYLGKRVKNGEELYRGKRTTWANKGREYQK